MKNLLENLTDTKNKEIVTKTLRNCMSMHFSIKIEVKKGNLTQEIICYGHVNESRYKGYYSVDIDDHEVESTKIGNIIVDNIEQLKCTLANSGLKTLSENIGISQKEMYNSTYLELSKDNKIAVLFEGMQCFELLKLEEQMINRYQSLLKHVNFSTQAIKNNIYGTDIANFEFLKELKEQEEITKKDVKAVIKKLKELIK